MDMDDNLPRKGDDLLTSLSRQDLAPYSVAELEERIAVLQAEISRVRSKITFAVNHKASADALFRR